MQDLGEAAILARVARAGLCERGPLCRDLKKVGSHIGSMGRMYQAEEGASEEV